MRKIPLLFGILLVATLGSRASGQTNPQTVFSGAHARDLVYTPVNTNNLVTPLPRTGSSITLGGIINNLNIPFVHTGSTTAPSLPGPSAIPTGPYKNAFNPVQPIFPK
jgi:hypothetical protein